MWSWSFPEGLAGKIMGFLNADIHRQYFFIALELKNDGFGSLLATGL